MLVMLVSIYSTNFGSVSTAVHWLNLEAVDQTLKVLTSSGSIHEGVFTLLSFNQIIPVNAVIFVIAVGTFVSGK